MDTIKINKGDALIVAHRGLSGIERENTAAAFVAAGNRSYFGIETDVRVTADGNFILLHDNDAIRCGGDNIIPEQSTLQTIQSVQLFEKNGERGRVDLRIPTMTDYLRICKCYDKVCVLEFKGYFSEENMVKVVDIVKAEYCLEKMIFISFAFENLVNLRNVCPEARCQFLTGKLDEGLLERLVEHKFDLDIWYGAFTEEAQVREFLDNGVEVNVWTVDKKEDAERLISWGVQYVTSNILE